ncbi:MAG: hypothetical protein IH831_09330 [Planctomycetes bacterium]|nr:hypothetical protein [Planctomycetota bacterium]
MSSTSDVRHEEQTPDLFNAYQEAVRKGEPFIATTIFEPAREIATLVRTIMNNTGEHQALDQERARGLNDQADEKIADEQINLDDENEAVFERIEDLFQQVSRAIRRRVTP